MFTAVTGKATERVVPLLEHSSVVHPAHLSAGCWGNRGPLHQLTLLPTHSSQIFLFPLGIQDAQS